MSVKELLADSWTNMLKNNFILKTILVSLATCLVYFVFGIACGIGFAIHYVVGIVVVIAGIIIGYPMLMGTTKVLWDVFQGREAKVFGFVSYGYHNIKKMWAILGRKILKMLLLYLLIIVLTIVMFGYTIYTIVSSFNTYNSAASAIQKSFYTSYEYDEDGVVEDADYDFDLDSFNLNDLYYDGTQSGSLLVAPEDNMASLGKDASEALSMIMPKLIKNAGVFVVVGILYIVIYVLFVMKSLFYTYSYLCAFDDENLTALESVEKSEDLMTGNRAKYFWTLFLIAVIFEVITGILGKVSESLIVSIANFIIALIYVVYVSSYSLTFFSKINTKKEVVVEEEPTPTEE